MAITSSAIIPSNSLEEFRIEFNKLVTDVDGISAASAFGASITFEGATSDDFETTLIVTDPTADRTITLPNVTGTVLTTANSDAGATTTSSGDADFVLVDDAGVLKKITPSNLGVGTPTAVTVADESSDTTCFPLFATAATGDLGPKSGSNLTFNSSSGLLTATSLSGGTVTSTGNMVIADGGTVGAASSTSAMTIASTGIVTFVDDIKIKDGGTIGVASAATAITIASTGIVSFVDDVVIKDGGTIGVTSTATAITISSAGLVTFSSSAVVNGTITGTSVKDEDNMASDSATHLASQQSIKAYTDTKASVGIAIALGG